MTVRIANAAGFWGDDIDAPRRLIESAEVDYLTLEYLAELTMSILARSKAKDANAGFATDVLKVIRDAIPALKGQPGLHIVTNAGGLNAPACAAAISQLLVQAGLGSERIGVVAGDDILPRITELRGAGCELAHLDTGRPLVVSPQHVACANVYLGAEPIAAALKDGARIVVTGRVADASLTVGPAVHEFGWQWDDWNRLAAATVAGHLIECGAQVTGGYSDRWQETEFLNIGYPIAELEADGSAILTKPPGSGGVVDRRSVIEQLVYEIGDPAAYYTPDVVADFTTVEVEEAAKDRVSVRGATGKPAPESLKVSLAYEDGYTASATLAVWGANATQRSRYVGELILRRLAAAGVTLQHTNIECLGTGAGVPLKIETSKQINPHEVVLRITVRDQRREPVERFTREIAPLITNGPNGLAGYASGRASVRPVLNYWPTLVPRHFVTPSVDVRAAAEWAEGSRQ